MNDQLLAQIIAGLESMPLETQWLLRGIQIGVAFAAEIEQSKREELIRCGIFSGDPSPDSCQGPGNHGPH